MGTTVRFCRCDRRRAAEAERSFIFDPAAGHWIMPEAPLRSMTNRARFRAFIDRSEYDHEDHSGEHVRYVTCPWCGGDLPGTRLDPPKLPDEMMP